MNDLIVGLPGEALVRKGLADFLCGRRTGTACLVGIAQSRFRSAGLLPELGSNPIPEAELQLYWLLRQEGGDAYSRYNALVRELISFEQALDRRLGEKLKAKS